jgi:hypothetical protein
MKINRKEKRTYLLFENNSPSRAKAYPCLLIATALASADMPLLMMRTMAKHMAAASLLVASRMSSRMGILCCCELDHLKNR